MDRVRFLTALLALVLLTHCAKESPQALGTLEWDRITLPATASEPIAEISAKEGQDVVVGQPILRLDSAHAQAKLQSAQQEVERLKQRLAELRNGERVETRAEAQARLVAAEAVARNAELQLARTRALVKKQLLPAAQLDKDLAVADAAESDVNVARAANALLANGSRNEEIAQAEAAVNAAQGQVDTAQIDLSRLDVRAPRDGRIDSLPYKLGDQPALGAPLAVLLVGATPYARIYVPEPLRAQIRIGDAVTVHVDGSDKSYQGKVRSLRSEPTFTPYYALNGKDAARLSYLSEVVLGADAAGLPAGLPVHAIWQTGNHDSSGTAAKP
jgi:HlyD family secretion protein